MEEKENLKKKRGKQKIIFFVIAGIIIIMAGALLLSNSKPTTSASETPTNFITSFLESLNINPYKNNPELDYFDVTLDNGLKTCYRGYCITYQPKFVMENGQVYSWSDIPSSIEKDLWKTQIARNKYKYGVDFYNVSDNIKNNLKYVALVRTNATKMVNGSVVPMTWDDVEGKIKIQGGNIILNDKVTLSHSDILSTYTIPVLNKTHIVIGNLDNNWSICDEWNETSMECLESHLEFNWKDNGDGTWNILFDPTITIDETEVITDSLLTNVTAETGKSNHTHLTIDNTIAPYNSLVGYWSADGDKEETKLTTAYDWSRYNNDGTYVGDTTANNTGIYGKGFEFDGIGDYVEIDSSGMGNINVGSIVL